MLLIFAPNMGRKRLFLIFLFALVMVAIPLSSGAQCAMCKQAAETSMKSDPHSMARSLNSGILYLMAVPYLLIAFIFRRQLFSLLKRVSGRFSAKGAR